MQQLNFFPIDRLVETRDIDKGPEILSISLVETQTISRQQPEQNIKPNVRNKSNKNRQLQ